MKKIGLLSDTHTIFDQKLRIFFADVDEIWHAGDIGNIQTADNIAAFKPLRAVYGNIDGADVRIAYHSYEFFTCEGMRIMMTHIGGYPGRYAPGIESKLRIHAPDIFICGHSHILKVIYDKKNRLLHINPGAAGISGFHNVRTAVRFQIADGKITDLEVGEWARANDTELGIL